MLSFNPEKKNCTGCASCYSVCPKQCISMIRDEEGFCYPELTSPDICVNLTNFVKKYVRLIRVMFM